MNKQLKITGYIGLLASLVMFTGDMLLYFTTQAFGDFEKELLPSMANVSLARLIAGGILGPLAACLYIVGFYHIYLTVKDSYKIQGKVMLTIFSISIIVGGAFHAFFPAFGIVSAQGHPEMINFLMQYLQYFAGISFILMAIGWLVFIYLTIGKKTLYPRLMIVATPMVWIWASLLWGYLPQPYLIVIAGGWNNLVLTIFFIVSLAVLHKKHKKT